MSAKSLKPGNSLTVNPMAHKVKVHLGELQAGEEIAVHQAGVDADFIRKNKRLFEGGVAEDHPAAEVLGGGDEFPPDPIKILIRLVLQGNPGPEAAVDKNVVGGGIKRE